MRASKDTPLPIFHPDDARGEVINVNFREQPQKELSKAAAKKTIINHTLEFDKFSKSIMNIELENHRPLLEEACSNLNLAFSDLMDTITFDTRAIRAAAEHMTGAVLREKARIIQRGTTGIYSNQFQTVLRTFFASIIRMGTPIIVLNPTQSGKNGTACAVALFVPAMIYRLTGVKYYPIFISTHLNAHRSQSELEFTDSLSLYGDVHIGVSDKSITLNSYFTLVDAFVETLSGREGLSIDAELNEDFIDEPTPATYNDVVLGDASRTATRRASMIFNRRSGNNTTEIRNLTAKVKKGGFNRMLIVDEPQYGASGEVKETGVTDCYGREKMAGNVFIQMIMDMQKSVLDNSCADVIIGFSATPFDTAYMDNVNVVHGCIPPDYVGFNFWGGKPIDPSVRILTPDFFNFGQIAEAINSPDMIDDSGHCRLMEYIDHGNVTAARKLFKDMIAFAAKNRFGRAAAVKRMFPELTQKIDALLGETYGYCVRFKNHNEETDEIISILNLEKYFQVFRHYGRNFESGESGRKITSTVAEILRDHYDPEDPRPPMFVVTNNARMGDNFHKRIEVYIEFARSAGDLNALLQSLPGRSCGNAKFLSQVFLSKKSAEKLTRWVDSRGIPFDKASRHAQTINGQRIKRGRPSKIVRIETVSHKGATPDAQHRIDVYNKMVSAVLVKINEQIVRPRYSEPHSGDLKARDGEYGNHCEIRQIIDSVRDADGNNIPDFLMIPENRKAVMPEFREQPQILHFDNKKGFWHVTKARPAKPAMNGKPARPAKPAQKIRVIYNEDEKKRIAVSFRWRVTGQSGHGGNVQSSASSLTRARQTDRAMKVYINSDGEKAIWAELQLNCRKIVMKGNKRVREITDKDSNEKGMVEAYMFTLPLCKEVACYEPQESDEQAISMANDNHVFASIRTADEAAMVAKEVQKRKDAAAARGRGKRK